MHVRSRLRAASFALALGFSSVLTACMDAGPVAPPDVPHPVIAAPKQLSMTCTVTVASGDVDCGTPWRAGVDADLIGGENVNVRLQGSNISYNSGTEIFQFDATVQNLMNEAIGTPDGVTVDPAGIKVFFNKDPVVTDGTGSVSVANEDGTGTFTATNQPYFEYAQLLANNEVSSARTWQLNVPSSVNAFTFTVLLSAERQYLLVINEVMVNSSGLTYDTNGDWVEIYNAGSRAVDLQNLAIADSAASGRRPYHIISSSVVVPSGGYVVLGATTNTTSNGGVPVDYAFGGDLSLASSLDAVKLSRVFSLGGGGPDTLTIDRTQYASAATSAQDGISRELKNPSLDNANMDGSNWGSASVTSVYGSGGRGTPKAQNSVYTPYIIDGPVALRRKRR